MPARKSLAPAAIPFHLPFRATWTEFPQSKVSRILLFRINLLTGPFFLAFKFQFGQFGVIRILGSIKVNSVGSLVGKALLFQLPDKVNLLFNAIGCLNPLMRHLNVQINQILIKSFGVEISYFPNALAFPLSAFFQFVFPGISIRSQMSDIGNVHYMLNLVAVEFQNPPQNIFKNVCSEVANMDRKSTRLNS